MSRRRDFVVTRISGLVRGKHMLGRRKTNDVVGNNQGINNQRH